MMRHVYKQVGTKFDSDAQLKAIGGFLILRSINPSLSIPKKFGVTTENINDSGLKELTNISRILQNLANETAPSVKNQYLAPFDDFVQQEILKVRNFYNNIITPEPKPVDSQSHLQVPHDVEQDSLAAVWNLIYDHKTELEKADEDGQFKELFKKIDRPITKKNEK